MKKYYIFNSLVKMNLYIEDNIQIPIKELKKYLEPYIYIKKINSEEKQNDLDVVVTSKVKNVIYQNNTIITNYEDIISFKRLINDLINRIIELKQGIFFHASSIEIDGYAYLIIGEKGSGKTTTMLNLLSSNMANYCANERTALINTSTGLMSYGNASSINIRANTLKDNKELLKKILPIIDQEKYNIYSNLNLDNNCKERLVITFNDLEKYLGVRICPILPPKGIINLVNDKNIDFAMEKTDFQKIKSELLKNKISGVFETRSYLEEYLKLEKENNIDMLDRNDINFYNLYKNNTKDISKDLVKRLKYERNNRKL